MSDSIDRTLAIATLVMAKETGSLMCKELKGVIEVLNRMPPAQQWIPCSERLPEDETVVLVCTEDEFMYLAERTCGNWEEITGFCSVNDTVAWMPLPEPYKGE